MLRNLKLCHLSRDLNCFRKTLDYQIDLKVYFTIQLYIRNGYISLACLRTQKNVKYI